MKRSFVVLLLILLSFFSLQSQTQLSDSTKISLLTANPWPSAVYAIFGHTAILVVDDSTQIDLVFNYGFFDSSKPHFIYHFVRGETDYILGITSYSEFLAEYKYKGVEVVEQELNLSKSEKQEMWNALYLNALPENREYRYNYFYDNCATRPRDIIENYIKGEVRYTPTDKPQSYRDLVDECTRNFPWIQFGISLLIGTEADRIIDVREKMFIPSYLKNSFEDATIFKNDTLQYPLVKSQNVILEENLPSSESNIFRNVLKPFIFGWIMLILTLIISMVQVVKFNKARIPKIFDTIIFGIAGLGGLTVFFLMYFSLHPATNPNWNFVWLNVFALIAVPLFWVKSLKNVVYIYHFINFATLTFFLACWIFIPQQLHLATIPFSMCLWIRSGINAWIFRKGKKKNKRFSSPEALKAGWGH
ncbi:MAG: DUF4105 domain-containing protein [Dysgonamonadaceae bacterium]|jgi:hypothetical protein|nr:DUF4105 domain-containing protein [Dysgonamonadaceae bacterium]MDD3309179.1 DUF4105 domain-containing protein [Dysgonamonadaceae bacterium]MDD3899718.1 DUF4105 domain-containing protein [Dysgonamonadaceae bacterium]MDD4398003.1 DUF4105 domain-containing protein [Dysgonamonadaceae bacterium]MEA5081629.1 DUF4105 domain-containing protein [Dysgonamonadaceae bacterium]